MITLIGTSHIAKESIEKVKRTIEEVRPDIIALELDMRRFYALQQPKQRFSWYAATRVGFKGFAFALIGSWLSRKLGRMVGVEPGDEMKAAIAVARKQNIRIALIDQDIQVTLSRFSKQLTWKERWRFFSDLLKSLFVPRHELKKYGLDELDLSKVPPEVLINKLLALMKERYPTVHRVLVEERNTVMAKRLEAMDAEDRKIVAVVGAGHLSGMRELLASRPGAAAEQ